MIHIITGKINSGKSTTINKRYNKEKKGDGFISVKRMCKNTVHGYDIVKLSDKTTKLFVIRDEFYDVNKEIACQIGPYLFLQETIDYIQREIRSMITQNISPIYLDEIGKLELNDKCFHKILKEIVDINYDCYITVREDLVDDIIAKYNIKEVLIEKM